MDQKTSALPMAGTAVDLRTFLDRLAAVGALTVHDEPVELGSIAAILEGNDKAVLFTTLDKLTDLQGARGGQGSHSIEDSVRSTYLEGDVRIVVTPPPGSRIGEQRLNAQRVFYDFATDRAATRC